MPKKSQQKRLHNEKNSRCKADQAKQLAKWWFNEQATV